MKRRRRAAALMLMVVVLAVVSLLLGALAVQTAAHRQLLSRQEDGRQAAWLARAGLEVAAGKLLADPKKYDGETVEILPAQPVKIAVRRDKEIYEIVADAEFASTGRPATRSLTRRYQRVEKGGVVRLELAK